MALAATGATASLLDRYRDELSTLLIVSEVELTIDESPRDLAADQSRAVWNEQGGKLEITVGRADGVKCPRCWRYVGSVSSDPDVEGLCPRCVGVLSETIGAR